MHNKQKSYDEIIKGTSIFGGVQIFNILLQIVRSKFIAFFLGPSGMGLIGLLNSTTGFVSGITGFGITTSAIKDIASVKAKNNEYEIIFLTSLVRKLMITTGIIGFIITIVCSKFLSKITFGNVNYTFAFIFLSVTLLITQINNLNLLLLQGFRKHKYLALSTFYGNGFSLIFSIPLIYFFKFDGIVPSIITTSFVTFYFSNFFAKKLELTTIHIPLKSILSQSANMVKMGLLINLSSLLTISTSYIVRIYIANKGGVEEVGLYSAGFAIINSYFGIILTAMGTDYYPRLASVSNSNQESNKLINQQSEVAILIISPILLIFIIFIKPIIIMLYSQQFLSIYNMIIFASIGMFFKTVTWAMGFLLLTKNANKIYFISELLTNIISLSLNVVGYKYFGITGLGISFLLSYLISIFQIFFIIKIHFNFSFENEFLKIFFIQLIFAISCIFLINFFNGFRLYIFGTLLIVLSIIFSLFILNNRINLINRIKFIFK